MHPYRFGKDKVYPLPLDPAKAPWSGPRGYSTSIPEEVAAYKASLPIRPPLKPKPIKTVRVKQLSSGNHFFGRLWARIHNHFIALGHDMFPRQSVQHPNGDVEMPRLIAVLCCLRAEVD